MRQVWEAMLGGGPLRGLVKLEVTQLERMEEGGGCYRVYLSGGFLDDAVVKRAVVVVEHQERSYNYLVKEEATKRRCRLVHRIADASRSSGALSPSLTPLLNELAATLEEVDSVTTVQKLSENDVNIDPVFPVPGYIRSPCCSGKRQCRKVDVDGAVAVFHEKVFRAHYVETKWMHRRNAMVRAVRRLVSVNRAPGWCAKGVVGTGVLTGVAENGHITCAEGSFCTAINIRRHVPSMKVQRALHHLYNAIPKQENRIPSSEYLKFILTTLSGLSPSYLLHKNLEIAEEELTLLLKNGRDMTAFTHSLVTISSLYLPTTTTENQLVSFINALHDWYKSSPECSDEYSEALAKRKITDLECCASVTGLPKMQWHTLAPPVSVRKLEEERNVQGLHHLLSTLTPEYGELLRKAGQRYKMDTRLQRAVIVPRRVPPTHTLQELPEISKGTKVIAFNVPDTLEGTHGTVLGVIDNRAVVAFDPPHCDLAVPLDCLRIADVDPIVSMQRGRTPAASRCRKRKPVPVLPHMKVTCSLY